MLMLLKLARDKSYKYFVRMELACRNDTTAKNQKFLGRDAYRRCICQLLCLCFVSWTMEKSYEGPMGTNVGRNG